MQAKVGTRNKPPSGLQRRRRYCQLPSYLILVTRFVGTHSWRSAVIHQFHGRNQTQDACKGSVVPDAPGAGHKLLEV